MTKILFQPYELNDTITLNNRILMAPLTRCMADDNLVPTQAMADYYARRADAGLIISESEYSHQATSIILPFRELFTSIFFI